MQAPTTSSTPRELVPAGNHAARLYEIIYIGEIETPYKDNEGNNKWQNKVRLTWELPNEMREFEKDGETTKKPMVISREVTFSLYKSEKQTAVLRTIANALVGTALKDEEAEAFDIDDLLGKDCMVEVSHEEYEGSKYAKPVGFGSIPAGLTVPEQINKSNIVNVREVTPEEVDALPEFIANKMRSSREYHVRFDAPRSEPKKVTEELDESNIPF